MPRLSVLLLMCLSLPAAAAVVESPIAIAIHGGAGTINREELTPEKEAAYHAALNAALDRGYAILEAGGSSLDAVTETLVVLENNPLFNAGRGAVFTSDGRNELDAAIMDGRTLNAGAVAGLTHVKNPVRLARLVMEESPHLLLIGDGAEVFGAEHEIEMVDSDWFYTDERWQQLQRRQREESDRPPFELEPPQAAGGVDEESHFGTVGAVALDRSGNLAAATSTGGTSNKRYGRVGDVPIVGAGTYANNATVAISATGHGEFIMRLVAAHDVSALMEYRGLSLEDAMNEVVRKKLVSFGGGAGMVALDKNGRVGMVFNTTGMYRGYIDRDGNRMTAIFDESDGADD